ncbi:DNA replication complex GINS protein PSF2 [Nilaparvata lugens]|uniref:DNA replication complex GINS protein PSF2 n=1 Tax=Nilaparvata lugens TaxID=108931 RepID=UPI00193DF590|nr:DNA replication complex GINS protein PSF2 [Nilaparvata lugens]
MDPTEIEFIAEGELITIIPSFSIESVIHLISGDFGPFRAGFPQTVPIWLAVYLKQRRSCKIVQPDWMDVELLEAKKEEEKNSRYFTEMPSKHYMEISNILLDVSCDDIQYSNEIKTIIKDIWDIRISKLRTSVDAFIKMGGRHAQLTHLTQLEINSIRPLLPDSFNALQKLNSRDTLEHEEDSAMATMLLSMTNRQETSASQSFQQDSVDITASLSGSQQSGV